MRTNYRTETLKLTGGDMVRVRLVSHRLTPCEPMPGFPWLLPSDVEGGFAVWNAAAQRLMAKRNAASVLP